jgi:formylmethanofuran dehydrogenase subunit D
MIATQGYVEINLEDAKRMALIPGEVVNVSSPRGEIQLPVRIVDTLKSGVVFVPFHFGSWDAKQEANELTVDFTDPLSKQPTFKQSSYQIETMRTKYKVSEHVTFQDIADANQLSLEELARLNRMMPPYRADLGAEVEVPLSRRNVKSPLYMPYRRIDNYPHFEQADLPYTKQDLKLDD